jgi:hypothetical protein
MQDVHVFATGTLGVMGAQSIVCHAEAARREQVRLVAIFSKGSRLTHQPVDDMAIVDAVLVLAAQAGHGQHQLLGIPDLDHLRRHPRFHPFPDQPGWHRVQVPFHRNRAAGANLHLQTFEGFQTPGRQRPQLGPLLGQTLLPTGIALLTQRPEKRGILFSGGKVPAATQQQFLLQLPFELVMALFDITVLMALTRVDGLSLHPVMTQQRPVTLREQLWMAVLMDSQAHPI